MFATTRVLGAAVILRGSEPVVRCVGAVGALAPPSVARFHGSTRLMAPFADGEPVGY
jgi:hypothetical protein